MGGAKSALEVRERDRCDLGLLPETGHITALHDGTGEVVRSVNSDRVGAEIVRESDLQKVHLGPPPLAARPAWA
jgi:hypothetical protein